MVKQLRTVTQWQAMEIRGTVFTTQQEATKRKYDNSGVVCPFIDSKSGMQVHKYGNIQQLMVCSMPGQPDRPVATVFWHEVKNEKFCKGHMPHLERGKATSNTNLNNPCEWLSVAYAQNIVFLPKDARFPGNNQLLAITRVSDYNPLHV